MKKLAVIFVCIVFCFLFMFSTIYAKNVEGDVLEKEQSTNQLLEVKENELKSLEDYKASYGSDTYGLAAYILAKVQIYSIPLVFIGIAISAIYQYVIGIKKLDVRDKGFSTMIAIITIGVICQILPLIFVIVVKSGV